jgi:hypothetical protein
MGQSSVVASRHTSLGQMAVSALSLRQSGSGVHFEPLGHRQLKGIADEWEIFSVAVKPLPAGTTV